MSFFKGVAFDATIIRRTDPDDMLGSFSAHSFSLDEKKWPTAEHYYQAQKFTNIDFQTKIHNALTPAEARKFGNKWFVKKRADFKKVRITLMTRAIYTKCKTHSFVCQALLDTGDKDIADNSFTDYFWGCGRDGRGSNHYGKILMRVRQKLKEEADHNNTRVK